MRKLNISIKDIQRIFNTSGSEVVLEVLGKKVDDSHSNRTYLGNMVNPSSEIKQGLGYHQYEIFVPIRLREKKEIF